MLLSAAAGAVDLVAVVSLGGAFAGIVTGNLVTLAGALATRDPTRLVPVAAAVAGFTLGVATCTLVWRRSREPRVAPLVAELVLLGALSVCGRRTARRESSWRSSRWPSAPRASSGSS